MLVFTELFIQCHNVEICSMNLYININGGGNCLIALNLLQSKYSER